MKLGIIRCMQTEDFCPGTVDFKVIKERKGAFENVTEEIEIIGFTNCGGCPAKKAVLRARKKRRGHHRFCLLHPEGQPHRLSMPIRQKDERHCAKRSGG